MLSLRTDKVFDFLLTMPGCGSALEMYSAEFLAEAR